MTDTKHTPGPWSYDEKTARITAGTISTIGTVAVAHAPDCRVSEIRRVVVDEYQRDANGRLLAAAPDLLDALDGLASCVTDLRDEPWSVDAVDAALAAARAAIEKATKP